MYYKRCWLETQTILSEAGEIEMGRPLFSSQSSTWKPHLINLARFSNLMPSPKFDFLP